MAKGERRARAPKRAARRHRTVIVVGITVLAAVVVGYFAYRAQANLPGVQFPDQGNLHVASAETPHELAERGDPFRCSDTRNERLRRQRDAAGFCE